MSPRNIEGYVHGIDGPVVVVPARIAAWMQRALDLDKVRIDVRGSGDTERDQVLAALHIAGGVWRSSATGTKEAVTPELAPRSQWLNTTQAGELLHITDRAVRMAIAQKRLTATRVGRSYRINREDIEQYQATRAA